MNKLLPWVFCVWAIVASVPAVAQIDFGSLKEEQIYQRDNKYNTWAVSLGYGPVIYYVDIIDYTVFPTGNWKFGTTALVSKQFNRIWGLDGQFLMADMYGQKNNRYFKGNLLDYSVNLTFNINQLAIFGPINDKWNIYGKVGIGLVYFRSRQQSLNEQNIEGELVAKDQYLQVKHVYPFISGYPNPYGWEADDYLALGYNRRGGLPVNTQRRQSEIVIPLGLGVKYRISKHFDVGIEMLLRGMTSDNLDVNYSGADNDSYLYTSFNLSYKLGKKNKRHAAWTYKDFNIAYRQTRELDPLAQKVDSLKQELKYLAGKDSVVSDTSFIFTQEVVYAEGISASVFFDFDKSDITSNAHREVAKVARAMKKNMELRIRIVGHCDARGLDDYNLKLSQRRCQAVFDVLVQDYGIRASRLQIDAKGESTLLSNTRLLKPRGVHMVNRRVDLLMIIE
ncbi:OmpA family protein [Marinilabiliaceae bacterium JC017]|nr:OmpA family protein [Marinilabiliaceae bacterium JC017]